MKPRRFSFRPSSIRKCSPAALALSLVSVPMAIGASGTFTSASGEWSTTTNWTPNGTVGLGSSTVPTTFTQTDVATFTGGGAAAALTVSDSFTYRLLRQITFNNTAGLANYTIGSSANTLYFTSHGADNTTGNIVVSGTGTTGSVQTIACNLMMTSNFGAEKNDLRIQTSDGFNGTLVLSGNISSAATNGISGLRIIASGSNVSTANSNSTNRITLSGIISDGTGTNKVAISRARNGVVLLTGANTFSGGFVMGVDTPADNSNAITLIGVDSVGTAGSIISGALGRGTLTLKGGVLSSDGTSARTILNSFVFAGGTNVLGTSLTSGTLTFAGAGSLTAGASIATNTNVTFSGGVGGTGGVAKNGAGTLTLTGDNTFAGTVNIMTGVVIAGSNTALGSTAGKTIVTGTDKALHLNAGVTITGETLDLAGDGVGNGGGLSSLSGTATWNGTINLTAAARVGAAGDSNLVLSGPITGSFALATNSGLGTGGTGSVTISAAAGQNTYTGPTNIIRGTLKLGADNTLPTATIVDVDFSTATENSVFDLNGYNQTVAGLRRTGTGGSGASTVTNSASGAVKTLTLDQSIDTTFNGNLSGNLALTKTGSGTLTLNTAASANTYTGGTSVLGGKLVVNTVQPLASGAVFVGTGGILGGTGTLGGATTIEGIHTPGTGIGTQRFSSGLVYTESSTFSWELGSETTSGAGSNFDSVIVTGNLAINDATFRIDVTNLDLTSSFWSADKSWNVFSATATTGSFDDFVLYNASNLGGGAVNYGNYGRFSFNASTGSLNWTVPEPSNALAGLLVAIGLLRRRRA